MSGTAVAAIISGILEGVGGTVSGISTLVGGEKDREAMAAAQGEARRLGTRALDIEEAGEKRQQEQWELAQLQDAANVVTNKARSNREFRNSLKSTWFPVR